MLLNRDVHHSLIIFRSHVCRGIIHFDLAHDVL
jgi:hypothetical protein